MDAAGRDVLDVLGRQQRPELGRSDALHTLAGARQGLIEVDRCLRLGKPGDPRHNLPRAVVARRVALPVGDGPAARGVYLDDLAAGFTDGGPPLQAVGLGVLPLPTSTIDGKGSCRGRGLRPQQKLRSSFAPRQRADGAAGDSLRLQFATTVQYRARKQAVAPQCATPSRARYCTRLLVREGLVSVEPSAGHALARERGCRHSTRQDGILNLHRARTGVR